MKMKKWLSLLLTLVFCLGLAPMTMVPALAAGAGTAGGTTTAMTQITVIKDWNDGKNPNRPGSVVVNLICAGDSAYSRQITLEDSNKWTYFWDVPAGVVESCTVEEDVPQGYQSRTEKSVDAASGDVTFTIINTLQREIRITKIWSDGRNQDGLRPNEVVVQVQGGGSAYDVPLSARSNAAGTNQADPNTWTDTVSVPKYDNSGNEIVYTVREPSVPAGYQSVVRDDSANGEFAFTVTNTHTPNTVNVTVTKVWDDGNDADGLRPATVTLRLLADGKEVGTATLGSRQGDPNGTAATGQTGSQAWTYTWNDLPQKAGGQDIVYSVEETNVPDGYRSNTVTTSANNEVTITITNTHKPGKTNVTVTKIWDDGDDADGFRPDTVTLRLLADGKEVGTATLSDRQGNANGTAATGQTGGREWTYTWNDLPKYDGENEIAYTVQEIDVPKGYTAKVTGDAAGGFTVTNTYAPETIDITITKVWEDDDNRDGKRPDSVDILVLANDEKYAGLTLTAAGNLQGAGQNGDPTKTDNGTAGADQNESQNKWTATITVPTNEQGKPIEYTVKEAEVEGYESKVTGDAAGGFVITNTPETAILKVDKVWEDEEDADGLRPESVWVNLIRGDNTWTKELSEDNQWSCSWDVPFRDADLYTVAEDTVPTGYKAKVTGDAAVGFTITNTHVPTGIGGGEDDPPVGPTVPDDIPDIWDFVPFLPPAPPAPPAPSEPSTPPALNKEDHFAYIIGTDEGYVLPEANITRAEVATIFFRLLTDESRARIWSQVNSFPDVTPEDWYNNAVSTMASGGILKGYEDGTFRPKASITRAEFATIAIRFFRDGEAAEDRFSDIEGHWGEAYINMAAEKGLIKGYPDSSFRPDEPITRAEAMTIINRLLERHPHKDKLVRGMIAWPDNADDSVWYYAEVQEATNSHAYEEEDGVELWTELLPVRDWAAFEKEWSTAFSADNPGDVVSEDVEIDLNELEPGDDGEEAPEEAEQNNGEEPQENQNEADPDNEDNEDDVDDEDDADDEDDEDDE